QVGHCLCASKGVSDELSRQDPGQVPSPQGRSGPPPGARVDGHLVRGSMVLIFLHFGYQKWWEYEVQTLDPFIRNGPLTFWMYPVFGLHGASYFLGVSEWLTAALLIWGFWNPKAGILGALLSVGTFITTVTIIPFLPDGWDPAAGFPAM